MVKLKLKYLELRKEVVVSNQVSIFFYGILIAKLCPIGNKAPFLILLRIVVSMNKNVQFCFSCRIQSDKSLLFKDLTLPNQKKYIHKSNC